MFISNSQGVSPQQVQNNLLGTDFDATCSSENQFLGAYKSNYDKLRNTCVINSHYTGIQVRIW